MTTKVYPPEAIHNHWDSARTKFEIRSTENQIMVHFIKSFNAEIDIKTDESIKIVGDGYPGKIEIFFNNRIIGVIQTSIDSDKKNYRTMLTK